MSETLWAPWRMNYILEPKSTGCVFCTAVKAGTSKHADNLILAQRDEAFVIMNRYPYSHAHIMVVPTRHISDLGSLSQSERACLFELTCLSHDALSEALNPQGMNIGMNLGKVAGAGIADHLHMHLVPRWEGDTNFMPMLADTRVMPDHLEGTFEMLQSHFKKLN